MDIVDSGLSLLAILNPPLKIKLPPSNSNSNSGYTPTKIGTVHSETRRVGWFGSRQETGLPEAEANYTKPGIRSRPGSEAIT